MNNMDEINKELFEQSFHGNAERVAELLELGADVNSIHTEVQATPLYAAVKNNHLAVTKLLIANGADANITILGQNYAPLHMAALNCNYFIAKNLILAGSDLNTYSCIFSPLYVAIQKHCLPVVKLLIENGASIYFDKPQYYHEVRDPISYAFFIKREFGIRSYSKLR
jgi:ankyrin repeat protein